jgi:hypothetical protein
MGLKLGGSCPCQRDVSDAATHEDYIRYDWRYVE